MRHELCQTTSLQCFVYSMQDKIHFNLIVDLNTKLNLGIKFKSHLNVARVLKSLEIENRGVKLQTLVC